MVACDGSCFFHNQKGFLSSQRQPTRFSGMVTVFHETVLPEAAIPAGYSALIDAYNGTPAAQTLSGGETGSSSANIQAANIHAPACPACHARASHLRAEV